jgi:hypothetical protein
MKKGVFEINFVLPLSGDNGFLIFFNHLINNLDIGFGLISKRNECSPCSFTALHCFFFLLLFILFYFYLDNIIVALGMLELS